MARYVLASLTPALWLTAACLFGGGWAYVALAAVTVLVYLLDRATHRQMRAREDAAAYRMAQGLPVVLAWVHFALLALGVRALGGAADLDGGQLIALALALGIYFGQISNANAHELIHAPGRWRRRLGAAVYVSLLFGHHVSAHLRVHHVWVASDRDPNSARLGEGFYRFWPRAWIGSFRAGWQAETTLRARRDPVPPRWSHPYVAYIAGAFATVALAAAIGGMRGVLALVFLAVFAQMQLMISDYIQHYGLRRRPLPDGKLEPVGRNHSWNARPWFSGAMMLNAPRHSDHHLHPGRIFPALRLNARTMPMLPSTFPVMGLLATCPPLWRRVMDRRVAATARPDVNLLQTIGGTERDDLPESDHAEIDRDSDRSDRVAAGRAIDHERRRL